MRTSVALTSPRMTVRWVHSVVFCDAREEMDRPWTTAPAGSSSCTAPNEILKKSPGLSLA